MIFYIRQNCTTVRRCAARKLFLRVVGASLPQHEEKACEPQRARLKEGHHVSTTKRHQVAPDERNLALSACLCISGCMEALREVKFLEEHCCEASGRCTCRGGSQVLDCGKKAPCQT